MVLRIAAHTRRRWAIAVVALLMLAATFGAVVTFERTRTALDAGYRLVWGYFALSPQGWECMDWCGAFDRRDASCARWSLGRSSTIGYTAVGFAGLPSRHVDWFQRILFRADNPEVYFERLLRKESRYAQIYGLIGLYWTDPERFSRLLRRYRTLEGDLRVRQGCQVGKRRPLEKIIDDLADGSLPRRYGTVGRVAKFSPQSAEAEQLLRRRLGFPMRSPRTGE